MRVSPTILCSAILGVTSLAFGACGGLEAPIGSAIAPSSDAGATSDGAARPTRDYGAPSDMYPAFDPLMGELVDNGGPIMAAPRIVTLSWAGDDLAGPLEDFVDKLGASTYWQSTLTEYGVGAATSSAVDHVHLGAAPAQMNDSDVIALLGANAGTKLPSRTSQTLYVLFVPPGTTLGIGGKSACDGSGGYHDETMIQGAFTPYAIVARCGSLASTTRAASRQIAAAATDPLPSYSPAWRGFTDATVAFDFLQRGATENGDPCALFGETSYADAQLGYTVQPLWSNRAGRLGRSPCQPSRGAYFNVTPLDYEDISVDPTSVGGLAGITTRGFRARRGQTVTFVVGFISDAPTSGPWTLDAVESNPFAEPTTGRLTATVDPQKRSGTNGEVTYVTVAVNEIGPTHAELLTLVSTLGSEKHYMPVLIGDDWAP